MRILRLTEMVLYLSYQLKMAEEGSVEVVVGDERLSNTYNTDFVTLL